MMNAADNAPVSAILTWDPEAIAQSVVDELREGNATFDTREALALARQDTDHLADKWDELILRLDEILTELSPRGRLMSVRPNVPAAAFNFTAANASEFLQQILHDARCTFTIGRLDEALYVSATSAGAPTDVYLITADRS